MKKLILSVLLLNLLAACSSNPPKEEPMEPAATPAADTQAANTQAVNTQSANTQSANTQSANTQAANTQAANTQAANTQAVNTQSANTRAVDAQAAAAQAAAAQAAADAQAALMQKNSVYFPFDVDAVQDADRETIINHAEYLASHPDVKVRVEGNADERGSSEYNLGLGQRRANNTKRALVLGGAAASQIETVSYGEEKPRCSEHNEACWAQNRRADINYSAQ